MFLPGRCRELTLSPDVIAYLSFGQDLDCIESKAEETENRTVKDDVA